MEKSYMLTEFARVLNSDRYMYTESDVFLAENMQNHIAVYDMFFRKTEDGGFAVVSGVQEVVQLIEILNSTSKEEKYKYFSKVIQEKDLLAYLVDMKFEGDVYAMRDGEIAYPNEPIITVRAPLIQAKILETPILNIMNHQLAVATKASRVTRAAHPIPVSAFGSRRAHAFDSSLLGNKAAYIGGCASHSNLITEYVFDIPSMGTMAHSFVQTFGVGRDAEKIAFDTFIKHRRTRKNNTLILLIDTYNTLKIGIRNAIQAFKDNGIDDSYEGVYGVRIDSGDLAYLSKKCREAFDEAGMKRASIILSSSLNEELILSLKEQGASCNYFGVGDAIAVSKSNPCFGGVYKVVEVDGNPVMKLSEDVIKISNPGFKKIYRIYQNNVAEGDLITLVEGDEDAKRIEQLENVTIRDEKYEFKSTTFKKGEYSSRMITRKYVANGCIIQADYEELRDVKASREFYLDNLSKVASERKRLYNPHKYKVDLSDKLVELKYGLIKKITKEIQE